MTKTGRLQNALLTLAMAAALALPATHEAAAGRLCDAVTVQFDNDEFGGSDRNYTGGSRAACARQTPNALRRFLPEADVGEESRDGFTLALGQSVFTPDGIRATRLITDDQPYAGWLYLGLGVERERARRAANQRHLDKAELQLGIVGPWSGAEQLQVFSHDVLNANEPRGWGNQLDNEPGINVFLSRTWDVYEDVAYRSTGRLPDLVFDFLPQVGVALGNIHTFATAGFKLRLGSFAPDDYGPPVIRPSLSGSDHMSAADGFSGYVFGGLEGRLVARNIFLDGNSYHDGGPSVDKDVAVSEARAGLVLAYDRLRLAYTHVFRSRDFDGGRSQIFGSVTVSVRL